MHRQLTGRGETGQGPAFAMAERRVTATRAPIGFPTMPFVVCHAQNASQSAINRWRFASMSPRLYATSTFVADSMGKRRCGAGC